jgi:GalNAc-alpha-(1->4)-GalNAc-alpha-(1->3)-diNAcBac-PP-undecaprenol alpha-1,4-N-acetyl-D-galactosaminyltransferase
MSIRSAEAGTTGTRMSGRPRHLVLVVSTLGPGGAERVLTLLANGQAERGERVTIVTLSGQDFPLHWVLHPAVRHVQLGLLGERRDVIDAVRRTVRRWCVLRATLRRLRPDVIVSFMDTTNVLTLAAAIGLGIPTLVAERNDPHEEHIGEGYAVARRLLYRRASAIVVQTARAGRFFGGGLASRVRVIPNPVVPPAGPDAVGPGPASGSGPASLGSDAGSRIVAMGRLTPQKGFDMLLRAFAGVAPSHPGWRLTIHGEGPERERLERERARLRLERLVDIPGVTTDPAAALRAATIFALPSRWEGFPNVLGEAMAIGRAVVAFDCPSGPSELVRHEVDGLLVPPADEAALAGALARLMDDPELRVRLAARAPDVRERFALGRVLDAWQAVISESAPTMMTPAGLPA